MARSRGAAGAGVSGPRRRRARMFRRSRFQGLRRHFVQLSRRAEQAANWDGVTSLPVAIPGAESIFSRPCDGIPGRSPSSAAEAEGSRLPSAVVNARPGRPRRLRRDERRKSRARNQSFQGVATEFPGGRRAPGGPDCSLPASAFRPRPAPRLHRPNPSETRARIQSYQGLVAEFAGGHLAGRRRRAHPPSSQVRLPATVLHCGPDLPTL